MDIVVRRADGSSQTVNAVPGMRIIMAPGVTVVPPLLAPADVTFRPDFLQPGDLTVTSKADGVWFVLPGFLWLLDGESPTAIVLSDHVVDTLAEVLALVGPIDTAPAHAGSTLTDVAFVDTGFGTSFVAGETHIVLTDIVQPLKPSPAGNDAQRDLSPVTTTAAATTTELTVPPPTGSTPPDRGEPPPPDDGPTPPVVIVPPAQLAVPQLTELSGANGFQVDGVVQYNSVGFVVSSAGDVNGDGFDDLLIGDGRGSIALFGKADGFAAALETTALNGTNGFRIEGVAPFDNFLGWVGASAGDVNGDGFDDLVIGSDTSRPNGNYSGSAFLIFGKSGGFDAHFNISTLNGTNGFRLNGVAYSHSGGAVSSGDVNGDGFDDLIVGASEAIQTSGLALPVRPGVRQVRRLRCRHRPVGPHRYQRVQARRDPGKRLRRRGLGCRGHKRGRAR
jgi:hypothetical protein